MKVHKVICLSVNVFEHLKNNNFNFSDWVEKTYKEQFMNMDLKIKQIQDLHKQIETLENEIKEIKTRQETTQSTLSKNEISFLKSVPALLVQGCDLKSLTNRFNVTYNHQFTQEEFRKTYNKFK